MSPVRAGLAAVGAVALASTLAGCASSASTPGGHSSSAPQVKPADDAQLLNALEIGVPQLNSAFGDNGWQPWQPTDKQKSKIGLSAFMDCTKGIINLDGKSTEPNWSFYSDSGDASSSSTTPSGKNTSSGGSSVPGQWVGALAIVYKDAGTAASAAKAMGRLDKENKACGKPTDLGKGGVTSFSGSVESNPSWYGSNSVVVFVDTKQQATLSALAQQRGRFVIVTFAKGTSTNQNGYYLLNSTTDSVNAAAAATSLLSQLTDAVAGAS